VSLRPLRAAVETWAPGRGIAADPLHRIAAAWPDIVGRNVAAHSEPIELNGATLLVATRSSAWSQQLQLLSQTILAAVAALPQAAGVRRLAFRSGGLRQGGSRGGVPGTSPGPRSRPGARPALPAEPAADAAEALARLRRRIAAARRGAVAACAVCGAAREALAAPEPLCAPCAGAAERERHVAVSRALYMAPWLTHAELREQLPDLSGSEYERVRRQLLQRWWPILERARRAGKVSRHGLERQIASSYILLQSRLPPDRITPAVVANLLGDDLVRALWP
jgi:hypothetical protein